jgi:hypothetical protein
MVRTCLGALVDYPTLPLLEVHISPWLITSPVLLTFALPMVNPLEEG